MRITRNAWQSIAGALDLWVVNRNQEIATALPFLCCSRAGEGQPGGRSLGATAGWLLLQEKAAVWSVTLLVGLVQGQEGCEGHLCFCSSLTSSVHKHMCAHTLVINSPHLPPCKRKSEVLALAQTVCLFLKAFLHFRGMYLGINDGTESQV